jgi:hypothetical protein
MPGRARSVGMNTALYADDCVVTLTAGVTVEIPTAGSLPVDCAVKVRAKAGASTLVGPLGKLALAAGQTADIFVSDGDVVADLGGTTTVLARTRSAAEEELDQLSRLHAAVDAHLATPAGAAAIAGVLQTEQGMAGLDGALREVGLVSVLSREFLSMAQLTDIKERTGSVDCWAQLRDAIAAVDGLYFPGGKYRTSKALKVLSDKTLIGAGRSTVIFNPQTDAQPSQRAAFLFGDTHPYAYDARNEADEIFPAYPLNAVAAGAQSVTTTTADHASNLLKGDFVYVATTAEDTAVTGYSIPHFAFLTRVCSDGVADTGVVDLADPVPYAVSSARLFKVGGTHPVFGCAVVHSIQRRDARLRLRRARHLRASYRHVRVLY